MPASSLLVLQFYNSLSRSVEPFLPIAAPNVSLYVCGPTVYDDAHLGHARCYITWDVLYRTLSWWGFRVAYTRNVTDVDDKIIRKAAELGEPPAILADRYFERFSEDMRRLNTLAPVHQPKATEHIKDMWTLIEGLLAKGFAYTQSDGSVYFRTQAMPHYGCLSQKPLDALQAGARVEVDSSKEHPADFALWKAAKASEMGWQSPWGWGRPGWHIECSAMIHAVLGEQIDIHAGGSDLLFPHHENEIAQSECFTGKVPFAKQWMHNGFVNVSGEKMSKSLGNFATVRSLLEQYPANTIRYFILTNHYRMGVDFSSEALAAAHARVEKVLRQVAEILFAAKINVQEWEELSQPHRCSALLSARRVSPLAMSEGAGSAFVQALAMDMNTPKALAEWNALFKRLRSLQGDALRDALHTWLQQAWVLGMDVTPVTAVLQRHESMAQTAAKASATLVSVLTLPTTPVADALPALLAAMESPQVLPATIAAWPEALEWLALQRWEAKQVRQFERADQWRGVLQALGYTVTDLPKGACRLEPATEA